MRGLILTSCVALAAFIGGLLASQVNALPYRVLNKAEYRFLGHSLRVNVVSDHRTKLFDPEPASIVMLGDSLTGYPEWASLLSRYDVVNFGIPGDTSSDVLDRINAKPFRNKNVFLLLGVNDLTNGVPTEVVSENIRKIVRALYWHGNRVYLQSTLFTRSDELNAPIKKLVSDQKEICSVDHCQFIDLNKTIAPTGVLSREKSIDDVHPNMTAYRQWAERVKGALSDSAALVRNDVAIGHY